MDENKFLIQNEYGEEVECEVLFTYTDEKTGKNYIAYTDNSLDEEGNTKVYASIFDPDANPIILQPIESEEDWAMVEEILAGLQSEAEQEELEDVLAGIFDGKSEEEIAEIKSILSGPLEDEEEE